MTSKFSLMVAIVVLTTWTAARADEKPADKPFDDAMFVKIAASGGMAEVELGKVGSEKGKSSDVKQFADRLVKDHTKANEELKAAAKAAGIEVPAKIDEKHQKHVEMFRNYKGENFDRDYAKHMVKDHEEDVALFTRASKEAKSQELKDFAAKTLPTLQEHLEMAKKLDK